MGEDLEEALAHSQISLHLARSLHMLPSVHFEMTLKSGYNQRPEVSSNLPKTLSTIGK